MRTIGFAVLVTVVVAMPARAQQDTIRLAPASNAMRAARVTAVTDTFTISNYRAGKVWRSSTLVRQVERVTDRSRNTLRQAQTYLTPDGVTVDTTWIDATTLAPIRYYADIYGERQTFAFDGMTVKGSVVPKDSASRDTSFTAPAPFFNAVAMDLVHQAVPLDSGDVLTFSIYNPPRGSIDVVLTHVQRERLPLKQGGEIEAVKLLFNGRSHLWVDARNGRLLVNGGGMGGNAFWKVRSDINADALMTTSLQTPPK